MARREDVREPVCVGITAVLLLSLMAQVALTSDVDREQIQRLKDQLAVESRPAGDQFVRFFAPPPRTLNDLGVDRLSPADLIRPQNAPQILALDVKCGADNMQIQLTFDQPFYGIIYSKGYFSSNVCHHVSGGSGRTSRAFTIGADSCGTRFNRHEDGREFMENSIVIQNDAGLQKAFDSARKIRCMLRPQGARSVNEKVVSYAFNVDTLHQKEVTFQTDEEDVSKANAVLDIQMGQGPYAPSVDGLVKIGDILTMVVEAEGDDDVDVRVRQCIAMNGDRSSHVNLTDDIGCTMKPNLLSPWLKTRQDKTVMAYSYFSAFKFPEQMDVIIECNLDLCKGECGFCQDDVDTVSQALERSRRSVNTSSSDSVQRTEAREPVRLVRRLRVVAPQDIAITEATRTLLPHDTPLDFRYDTVCLSVLTFVISLVVILLLLFVASIATAVLCVRVRGQNTALVTALPDASFHAFSSITGKP